MKYWEKGSGTEKHKKTFPHITLYGTLAVHLQLVLNEPVRHMTSESMITVHSHDTQRWSLLAGATKNSVQAVFVSIPACVEFE